MTACPKACITVVSQEPDWGDVRGVTLRGHAVVLPDQSPDALRALVLLRHKFPESHPRFLAGSPPLALVRFDPLAAVVLDHWDGIGFSELLEHPLVA